jgi:hypothetical protein
MLSCYGVLISKILFPLDIYIAFLFPIILFLYLTSCVFFKQYKYENEDNEIRNKN